MKNDPMNAAAQETQDGKGAKVNDQMPPTTPTPEDSTAGGQGAGKTFTQEDVNRIVSERLARERDKLTPQPNPVDEREADIAARESRLDCREYLLLKNYPADLLEILDTSDPEQFKASVDRLQALFGAQPAQQKPPAFVAPTNSTGGGKPDPLAAAFKSPTA